ncbi:MAG TPA: hypothetical protein VIG33_05330 [Pseudobdellovibrionaceae bacterium]|jgi:hypothetical protein
MYAVKILKLGCRQSMIFLVLFSFQAPPVLALPGIISEDAGLLPIEKSTVNQSLIDELFNPAPVSNNWGANSFYIPQNPGNNQNHGNTRITTTSPGMKKSNVKDEFKCNLFENVPYEDILSALNSLNQAVSSPACGGPSQTNVQGIVNNNKTIADAIKDLRGFVENPGSIQPENAADISNKVDLAIRAATTIANSFAQSDLLSKECRQAMSAGQVATSINDLINGLTPYALMAATMTTGGAAAVPYIVGGSIITGAIGSMNKIIDENGVQVEQPEVRRAIVENTCQFIRLDQKYKFLIKSRDEQISKITTDLSSSKRLFSAKLGVQGSKNAVEKFLTEIDTKIPVARSQLEMDKQFMRSTSDDLKICQLGIQLTVMAQDKASYVSTMLTSLDKALAIYGTNNVAQAQALKLSGTLAAKDLRSVAVSQFSSKANYKKCAESTKSFIETIGQSASLAKELVTLAQENLEKGLQGDKEYNLYKYHLLTLNQKQFQAQRVTDSLDKLQAYATTITQAEIDSEMDRLRRGLFNNSYMGMAPSPVLKWFKFVNGLHREDLSRFKDGLSSLRLRAYQMSPSGKAHKSIVGFYAKDSKDGKDAANLVQFNLKDLPMGTPDHDDICREMRDVWNRWTSAIDYLAASDAFCNMLEPYVYDNRPEDRSLVAMCRGYSKSSPIAIHGQAILSTVANMKNRLVVDKTRDWALYLQKKIEALNCVDNFSVETPKDGNMPKSGSPKKISVLFEQPEFFRCQS